MKTKYTKFRQSGLRKSSMSEETRSNTPKSHHPQQDVMAADLESAHEKSTISEGGDHDQQASERDQITFEQETNDNVVDWNGPDDPQNPRNWPAWKRMTQVFFATTFLLTA